MCVERQDIHCSTLKSHPYKATFIWQDKRLLPTYCCGTSTKKGPKRKNIVCVVFKKIKELTFCRLKLWKEKPISFFISIKLYELPIDRQALKARISVTSYKFSRWYIKNANIKEILISSSQSFEVSLAR